MSAGAGYLEPDREQISSFVSTLFAYASPGNTVSLRSFHEYEQSTFRITPWRLNGNNLDLLVDAAVDDALRAANAPKPVVFCPPIATFKEGRQAREQDLVEALALSVECDANAVLARSTLETLLGPASVIVASGGEWTNPESGEVEDKLHCHWRLHEPARGDDLTLLKKARRLATAIVAGDPSNIPAAHPIRWPGSWHRKGKPRLCRIIELRRSADINLQDAIEKLQLAAPEQTSAKTEPNSDDRQLADLIRNVVTGKEYHPSLVPLASRLLGSGTYPGATVNLLRALMEVIPPESRDSRWWFRRTDIPRIVRSAQEKWGANEPANGSLFDPWERFCVPGFPLEVLPQTVRRFVETQSAIVGCDTGALAMAALVNFSGALDHRFALKMMRHGRWWAHPRLWVCLVGDPSRKKTPLINASLRELEDRQKASWKHDEEQRRIWKAEGGDPQNEPVPSPRYVTYDSTIEKLGIILARYDRGVLVKRDELAGWIGTMEKYATGRGASADRAFWLQAYDGGEFVVDRVSRPDTFIRNLSVSIIGGIQPARLADLHGLTSDGLLQRFLPVMMGAATFPIDNEESSIFDAYSQLTRRLLHLEPQRLLLADDGLVAMEGLRRHVHDLEQTGGGLAESFTGFVGKLAGNAGSLALILHMIDSPEHVGAERVSASVVERVDHLVRNFILPHALEFYRTNERASGGDKLQRLASWILTNGKQRIVASDLTSNIADMRGLSLWDLNQRVSPLVAGGWLTPTDPGPVSRSWSVSSVIFERFKLRAHEEEGRKAKLAELMSSPRRRSRKDAA